MNKRDALPGINLMSEIEKDKLKKESEKISISNMTVIQFLGPPVFGATEIEVIKKAYGFDKNKKISTLTDLSIGLRLPTEVVQSSEGSALAKLKTQTEIVPWLESKVDLGKATKYEIGLLAAICATNATDPKPFRLRGNIKNGAKESKNIDTRPDAGIGVGGEAVEPRVGSSNAYGPNSSKKETAITTPIENDRTAKENNTGDKSGGDASRNLGIEVKFLTGQQIGEFERNLTNSLGNMKNAVAFHTIEANQRQRKLEWGSLLISGVKFSSTIENNFVKIISGDSTSFGNLVYTFLNWEKRDYNCLKLKSWFNPVSSKIEYVALITYE